MTEGNEAFEMNIMMMFSKATIPRLVCGKFENMG
jgi:hypothetical protein